MIKPNKKEPSPFAADVNKKEPSLFVLKTYFGHAEFRDGQEQIINCILSGRDVLGVMPTGAGKSICYQLPALMMDGVTLVVSPLISLMKDQVNALTQSGVHAAFLNRSLTAAQYGKAIRQAGEGRYKIIYVAPERLMMADFLLMCSRIDISLVAVDESHCVSQWGQDFRPSYLKIVTFVEQLRVRPVIAAFTATATREVKMDISGILRLRDPYVITTGFDRPNLHFSVKKPEKKPKELLKMAAGFQGKNGIVYCATRKVVEEVCDLLCEAGFLATRYHAGLSDEERELNQEDFIFDRRTVMVATNAFGMGIDKSNVSFVIHYNMPKNLEAYYQEAGRAGRDGGPADCCILYSGSDVRTNLFLIDNSEPNPDLDPEMQEAVKAKDREKLKRMTFYCTTDDCLRGFILKYFGEAAGDYCGNCSNCAGGFETVDITASAQKIFACIAGMKERYGINMVIDVLRGSRNERILALRLCDQPAHGSMRTTPEIVVRKYIMYLLAQGFLESGNDEYGILKLSEPARPVMKGLAAIEMKTRVTVVEEQAAPAGKRARAADPVLFAKLKELRRQIAERAGVPAYVIFSDATLTDMCSRKPKTLRDLLGISGVGKVKQEKYGKIFIDAINGK